ncbi:general alpha-glucoside [Phlyctema vagabunda]|uniref:General alpha-glucoside n=1 Tax=Phlyctema vagabunda TaxID=108571 RepID=A0ABR4P7V5_9HELO
MVEVERSPTLHGESGDKIPKPSPTLSGSTRHPSIERASKPLNEQSPLLSPTSENLDDHEDDGLMDDESLLAEDPKDEFQETKSIWYLILLTLSIGGLQIAWSVELSNGSPYLLSLGLSKSLMALVWIAGPVSGTLVQPYIGILSDNCRSRWGKRKPFMVVGAIATIISLLALSWVREIVGGILGLFGANRESQGVKNSIIVVAVLFVYVLDFSINTEAANAMASRIVGVGNIIGYVAGYLNLPKLLWFFGNTQFKVLCVIASLALGSTVALSSATIKERDASLERAPPKTGGLIAFFKTVFGSILRLPPQTRKVCEVQFFAWIGFFPQLFYSSAYVGDIYVQPFLEENPNMTPAEIDRLYEKATRVGTFALLVYAIASLTTNVLLPFLIAPTYDTQSGSSAMSMRSQKSYTTRTSRFLDSLVIPWLTLRRAWLISHCVFAACMFSTLLVRTVTAATVLIGVVGISWALTLWAPFAIISAEISKRHALRRSRIAEQEGLDSGEDDSDDQAGIILGIHNMAIAAPQIIATVGSSILFKFLQKPRGTPGDRSLSVVLAAGGFSTLVAAFLTSRIKDEVEVASVPAEEGRNRSRRESRPLVVRSQSFGGLEY